MSTAGEAGCSSVPSTIAQRRSSAASLWPMASLGITWSGARARLRVAVSLWPMASPARARASPPPPAARREARPSRRPTCCRAAPQCSRSCPWMRRGRVRRAAER
eukprot:scaffold65652_cov71-Phaeocystis_antarctica.AAC.11